MATKAKSLLDTLGLVPQVKIPTKLISSVNIPTKASTNTPTKASTNIPTNAPIVQAAGPNIISSEQRLIARISQLEAQVRQLSIIIAQERQTGYGPVPQREPSDHG